MTWEQPERGYWRCSLTSPVIQRSWKMPRMHTFLSYKVQLHCRWYVNGSGGTNPCLVKTNRICMFGESNPAIWMRFLGMIILKSTVIETLFKPPITNYSLLIFVLLIHLLTSNFILFFFTLHLTSCFFFLKTKMGWCYYRLYRIPGWNHTGKQDEVYPELQVDWHLTRKHAKVKPQTEYCLLCC